MDEKLKAFIGGRVKSYRKAKGITQAELGDRIERSDEAISNLERGKSLPEIQTLIALASELGKSVQDFLPDQGSIAGKSHVRLGKEAELSSLASNLSDQQLDIAIAQVTALSGLGDS